MARAPQTTRALAARATSCVVQCEVGTSDHGPVVAVFLLYPLTEWLGSFRAFGELRLLIFAVIVLLVLLFMPRGLAPWVRDKIEAQCPRCKQRNISYRKICRLCGAALQPEVAGAQRLVGHQ